MGKRLVFFVCILGFFGGIGFGFGVSNFGSSGIVEDTGPETPPPIEPTPPQPTARSRTLFSIPSEKVTAITIGRPNDAIHLIRTNKGGTSGWEVAQPYRDFADTTLIDRILDLFHRVESEGFAEGKLKDKKFGFIVPSIVHSLTLHQGKQKITLFIGYPSQAPHTNGPKRTWRYVMWSNRKDIGIVPTQAKTDGDHILSLLRYRPERYRSRQVFQFPPNTEFQQVNIQQGDQKHAITYEGGSWSISGRPTHSPSVFNLINDLMALRVASIEARWASNPGNFGIGKDSLHVALVPAKGAPQEIRFGKRSRRVKGRYCSRVGTDLVMNVDLSGWMWTRLTNPYPTLEPTTIVKLAIGKVQAITLAEGKTSRVLRPGDAEFKACVERVVPLEATRRLPSTPDFQHLLEAPWLTITVKFAGKSDPITLTIGRATKRGDYVAQVNEQGQIFTLSAERVDFFDGVAKTASNSHDRGD